MEVKDEHELSIDTKMSSGVLETTYCAVSFWDGSVEYVQLLSALKKVVDAMGRALLRRRR